MREVKSRDGTLRAARAVETRERIVDAARRRFRTSGYAATTLREIALEAGVAVQTVYAVFGSKANILRELRLAVVGDTEADAAWGEALGAATVDDAVRAFARSIRLRWEHGADIVAINVDAASADPQIRAEVAAAERVRRTGIGEVARALVALEPGIGRADLLAAQLEAITVTTAYEVLTAGHGWTADAYEAWLTASMAAIVARAATPGR